MAVTNFPGRSGVPIASGSIAAPNRPPSFRIGVVVISSLEEFVSVKQLAETLGLDRSNARKYVLKLGIKPHKRRTPDSRNQLTLAVTQDEVHRILRQRESQGLTSCAKVVESDTGVLYVIQSVPELDPKRVKLGFTLDLSERVAQHRTAGSTAVVLKSWPCRRARELTAMDSVSSAKCRLIRNEVFKCDYLDALLRRGDDFFALLPEPASKGEVSEYSPYRKTNGTEPVAPSDAYPPRR